MARPARKDDPQKITLYLSAKAKQGLMKLAFDANQSASQWIQSRIEQAVVSQKLATQKVGSR